MFAGTERRSPNTVLSQEASNGMSATTYDLSFEQALGELQAALGRPVNVMIRPRDPGEQPTVIAHMSGRLMRADTKYSAGRESTRAAQGESLFFSVAPLGLDQLVGLDGFYVTEKQFDGALSVEGEKASRLHLRVGRFELLIAMARGEGGDGEGADGADGGDGDDDDDVSGAGGDLLG
jgi:hypothetical protein